MATIVNGNVVGTGSIVPGGTSTAPVYSPSGGAIIPQGGTPGTPIPTKAPTGQTSTSSAPATPTTVVNTQPAQKVIQQAQQTMVQAQAAQQQQQVNNQQTTLAQDQAKASNQGKPGYDIFGNPIPTAQTPDQQMANTPDSEHQWIYDKQGNRTQNPITQPIPPGYSTTNPASGPTTPVADQTTDPVGNVYKQFFDGTYGKFSPMGAYIGSASQNDFSNSKNGETALSSLNQLANGTFPLSANEQSQVDALKASFQQLITQQATANANLTGGTTVAMNLYGMGNSVSGLGEIKGTIDSGVAKIADLNSKMGAAVSSMEQGFRNDDIKAIQAAYTAYSDTVKARASELTTMQAAAQKALVDAQTAARDNQTLALTKMMDDNTISYQAKQQAMAQTTLSDSEKQQIIDNDFKQKTLNLETRKQNFAENQAKNAAAGANIGNSLPQVGFTASGHADPAQQAQFLESIPGGPTGMLATQIKSLSDYTMNAGDFTVRTTKGSTQIPRSTMVALAKQYDPSYSDTEFTTRQKYLNSLQPGGVVGQKLVALNTAVSHMGTLANDISKLDNSNFQPYNVVKNNVLPLIGLGSTAGARLDIGGVTGELATAFKAAGATDAEIKSLGTVDHNSTPADIHSYITSATELLAGKVSAQTDGYVTTMGKAPNSPLVSPTALKALSGLKNGGYQIDIPGVQYTDKDAYIKYDPSAQANLTAATQQLQVAGLPLTPENILQMAQSQ